MLLDLGCDKYCVMWCCFCEMLRSKGIGPSSELIASSCLDLSDRRAERWNMPMGTEILVPNTASSTSRWQVRTTQKPVPITTVSALIGYIPHATDAWSDRVV